MASALATIAKFKHLRKAVEMRRLLAADGIEATIVRAWPLFTVQVTPELEEEAEAVLNRMYGVDGAEEAIPRADAPPAEATTCPACGATDVERHPRLRLFVMLTMLAIGVAAAVGRNDAVLFVVAVLAITILIAPPWHCRDCGERWSG